MNENKNIILFDGVCNLCNGFVQFVIKYDKKNIFKFASLQSKYGQALLEANNLELNNFNSFIYYRNNVLLTKSSASLYVLKDLGRIFVLGFAFIIIPKFIRDGVYNLIAKNRYKWFGRQNVCWLPTEELKNRFVDDVDYEEELYSVELDRRTVEYEDGKAKTLTLKELEEMARNSYKKSNSSD